MDTYCYYQQSAFRPVGIQAISHASTNHYYRLPLMPQYHRKYTQTIHTLVTGSATDLTSIVSRWPDLLNSVKVDYGIKWQPRWYRSNSEL